ncbi:DnaA N-terminal domain-containing protein, partial [Rickettsia sp. TH2014]|uniref:DnaA N-terminal domain-containing protein n=1 Tax=Rickettsia sp. TH2014 TaxID=1967503 RepID=UPI00273C2546
QIRKKIAGRFSTELAYKILTIVEFKANYDNSFITALVPSHINLSQRQIACISEQLEAVYGINGYYVQELEEKETMIPKKAKFNIDAHCEPTEKLASSNKSSAISEEILENTVWNRIRKGLREELGEVIDAAWFSKAVAAYYNETKTLTLTMPTRFMADWVRNNYSHVI